MKRPILYLWKKFVLIFIDYIYYIIIYLKFL